MDARLFSNSETNGAPLALMGHREQPVLAWLGVRVIGRVNALLASGITRVLIPDILAGYKGNVLDRAFPFFAGDLIKHRPWIAGRAVPTEVETPA